MVHFNSDQLTMNYTFGLGEIRHSFMVTVSLISIDVAAVADYHAAVVVFASELALQAGSNKFGYFSFDGAPTERYLCLGGLQIVQCAVTCKGKLRKYRKRESRKTMMPV